MGLTAHVHAAQGLTLKIHEACAAEGVRAIVSRGWGGLGELPDVAAAPAADVFAIGSVPHDWLFPQCSGAAPGAAPRAALLGCLRPVQLRGFVNLWLFHFVNLVYLLSDMEAVCSGVPTGVSTQQVCWLLHGEQAQAGGGDCCVLLAGVVHHGGAGTTASGLLGGCPTTVVYIFGMLPRSRLFSAALSVVHFHSLRVGA
jgi:hypothetical protein